MNHPLTVRRPDFQFPDEIATAWLALRIFKTTQMNAYNIIFPALERLMIGAIQRWRPESYRSSPLLSTFLAQEVMHARMHERSIALLQRQGYRLDKLLGRINWIAHSLLESGNKRIARDFGPVGVLAVFAAAEHWTAAIAATEIAVAPEAVPPSDMVRLFFWHGAEELEHRSVVFEMFLAEGGSWPMRMFGLFSGTIGFVLMMGVTMLDLTTQGPRVYGLSRLDFARAFLRDMWDARGEALEMAGAVLRYVRPSFHPAADARMETLIHRALALSDVAAPAEP